MLCGRRRRHGRRRACGLRGRVYLGISKLWTGGVLWNWERRDLPAFGEGAVVEVVDWVDL